MARSGSFRALAFAVAAGLSVAPTVRAVTQLDWSPAGLISGGTGTWDTTTSNWANAGLQFQTYDSSSATEAIFAGAAGTVTLASTPSSPLLAGIVRVTGAPYTFQGGPLTVSTVQLAGSAVATFTNNIVGSPDLTLTQTDATLSHLVSFSNDNLALSSLAVTNTATPPSGGFGLVAVFDNAQTTLASANTTLLNVDASAALSFEGGSTVTIPNGPDDSPVGNALDNGDVTLSDTGTSWSGGYSFQLLGTSTLTVSKHAAITGLANLISKAAFSTITINSGASVSTGQIALNAASSQSSLFTVSDQGTTVSTGTFGVGGLSATQQGGVATATIADGAALQASGTTTVYGSSILIVNKATLTTSALDGDSGALLRLADPASGSALTIDGSDNTTFAGTIDNVLANGTQILGGITKSGTGSLTLTGTNTFSGPTIINGGSIVLGNPNALESTPVSVNVDNALNFNNQATANIAALNGSGSLNLGDTNIILNGAFPGSYAGTFNANTGGINQVGINIQTLTGGTSAAPSTLGYLAVNFQGTGGTQFVLDGGNLLLTDTGSTGFGGTSSLFVDSGGKLFIRNGSHLTTYGTPQVHNAGSILVSGNGTLWTNTASPASPSPVELRIGYAGSISTLVVSDGARIHSTGNMLVGNLSGSNPGTGNVSVDPGSAIQVDGNLGITTGSFVFVTSAQLSVGSLQGGGLLAIADPTSGAPALTIAPQSPFDDNFTGQITDAAGAGSLYYQALAGSSLVLDGVNAYSGNTTITGPGHLIIENSTSSSDYFAYGGGTLHLAGTLAPPLDPTLTPLPVALTPTGEFATDATSFIHFYAANVTGGTFSGNGVIDPSGNIPGTSIPAPIATTTFAYTVFEPGSSVQALGPTTLTQLTNAGVFTFSDAAALTDVTNATTGNITLSGAATLHNFLNDGQVTLQGAAHVKAAGYLYFDPGSTLTITPDASLAVSNNSLALGGHMLVDGAATGPIVAQDGSIISGAGSLERLDTHAGATLAPGSAAGTTLTIDTLNLGSGTILDFSLAGLDSPLNTLLATSTLTLGSDITVHISAPQDLAPGAYALLTYSQSVADLANLQTWTIDGPAGFQFALSDPSGVIHLTVTAVPEPASLALLAAAPLIALRRRRRPRAPRGLEATL